jgi:hypothetical protein
MNEREFQNMFIFCPGFEAAALKIPLDYDEQKKQIVYPSLTLDWLRQVPVSPTSY